MKYLKILYLLLGLGLLAWGALLGAMYSMRATHRELMEKRKGAAEPET